MSATIVWSLTGLYLALWLFCFIHCIRNRSIYRPFNCPSLVVKVLWIAFLFTFSVFAITAYLIFGLALKHKDHRPVYVHLVSTAVIMFCVFLAWPQRSLPDRAVRMVRGESDWREISDEPEKSVTLPDASLKTKMRLGVIAARTNVNTTSHSSYAGNAKLTARRIAITVDNDHPLLQESAELLIEALKAIPYVESIEFIPFGKKPPSGGVLPDVWIRLSVPQISVIQIPPQLKIKTRIDMSMTTQPFDSIHSYHESYSIPSIDYGLSCELFHDSTTTAIGTGNTKYQLAANEIAQELIKPIESLFADNIAKYGSMPDEIDRFVPEAVALPELPLQVLKDRAPYVEGLRPLVRNTAFWVLNASDDMKTTFESFIPEMEAGGWKTQRHSTQENSPPYIRFSKDRERLFAFTPMRSHDWLENKEEEKQYVIAYERYLPLETVTDELRKIIADEPPVEFLMMMKDWIWRDQELRQELLEVLENSKDSRPDTYLEIASLLGSMKEYEKQWVALQKANALESMIGSEPSKKSSIDDAIKKFEKEHQEYISTVSLPELYESFGARPLPDDGTMTLSQTVGLNQPVAVYRLHDDGKMETIAAFMIPTPFKNSKSPHALRLRHCKDGSSMSTSGEQPEPGKPDAFRWDCHSSEEDRNFLATSHSADNGQFSIELKITTHY